MQGEVGRGTGEAGGHRCRAAWAWWEMPGASPCTTAPPSSVPELKWPGCRTHLGHQVLEAGDDVGALKLLVVAKAAGDHDHGDEGQGQVQLRGGGKRARWMRRGRKLPAQGPPPAPCPRCSWARPWGFPCSARKPHALSLWPVAPVPVFMSHPQLPCIFRVLCPCPLCPIVSGSRTLPPSCPHILWLMPRGTMHVFLCPPSLALCMSLSFGSCSHALYPLCSSFHIPCGHRLFAVLWVP